MATKVQFSLRMIFVVTAVVALFAAEAVAFPEWFAGIAGTAITLLLPSAFVAQIVYARGAGRAFGIGAFPAWLATIGMLLEAPFQIFDGGRIDICVYWVFILAGGCLAALVRWLSMSK